MRLHVPIGVFAILFGIVTVFAGTSVLIDAGGVRGMAGDVVPPVLWFNAGSGVVYVVAGLGILMRRRWAVILAWGLVAAIGAVLAVFVWLAVTGTPWEPRTLGALLVRLLFWVVAAPVASRTVVPAPRG